MDKNKRSRKAAFFSHRRISCVFALILALVISLSACGGPSAGTAPDKVPIYAKIDQNGTASLPLMDGNVITIKGDVCRAIVLEDRSTILVLERDGLLYSTTVANTGEKTTIAEDVTVIKYTATSGVIYENVEEEIFRYLFTDASTMSFGKDVVVVGADNTLSTLYANTEGNIYLLPENATEPEKIAHYDNVCGLRGVSDDGKTAVWVEKDSSAGIYTTYCYANGNRIKLEEIDSKYDYCKPYFNKSQTFLSITDSNSQKLHTLVLGSEKSEDFITVKLGNDLRSNSVDTKNGELDDETSDIIDGLYVMVEADSNYNVYYIADGDREKVLGNVSKMTIRGGRIYYVDEDGNLYTAKLNGSELEEEKKVAGDVECFKVSSDGNYAYFFKNSDNNVGAISRYNVKTDDSEKITSNAHSFIGTYYTRNDFYLSADGKTVYYFEDVEENIGSTYSDMGTLKCATVGSEPVKIATDIIVAAPVDGTDSEYVNPAGFTIAKYVSEEEVDGTNQLVVNWMFFDGTEAKIFARDVYNKHKRSLHDD